MRIIKGKDFSIEEPSAVAIGKFDGLHKGHKLIIDELVRAKEEGLTSIVFSFEPSPEVYFGRQAAKYVLTEDEKQEILAAWGVDIYILYPFDEETAKTEAEDFLREILVGRMNMKKLAAGEDLSFGYRGAGNTSFLEEHMEEYGYKLTVLPKLCVEEREISASVLRDAIEFGEMESCAFLMGRDYMISGEVCEGNHIGHTIGFPTCNIIPTEDKLLPPNGVYITCSEIEGTLYSSVTNIGYKPTVSEHEILGVETYLLDVNIDCYHQKIKVYFCSMLRKECKFESFEKLQKQLAKDKKAASDFHRLFKNMI